MKPSSTAGSRADHATGVTADAEGTLTDLERLRLEVARGRLGDLGLHLRGVPGSRVEVTFEAAGRLALREPLEVLETRAKLTRSVVALRTTALLSGVISFLGALALVLILGQGAVWGWLVVIGLFVWTVFLWRERRVAVRENLFRVLAVAINRVMVR